MEQFNIENYKGLGEPQNEYEKRIKTLQEEGIDTKYIKKTINKSVENLDKNIKSFVIYGEPQSGKTELMIALTAKLLDKGNKTIIILLNDNVGLLDQNLGRFSKSNITPDPKNYTEILDKNIQISGRRWIIFCKKNSKDLQKLIDRFNDVDGKIIIDDESDYASPNGKINKEKTTKINELIGHLLKPNGKYIGVTATPARLDLNNTFDNKSTNWINFESHKKYTGQDVFFPVNGNNTHQFNLTTLGNEDDPKYLRDAFFRFLIHSSYLNLKSEKSENYVMLIHTSGKKLDHDEDYEQIIKIVEILKGDDSNKKFPQYVESIYNIAKREFDGRKANEITRYILNNKNNTKIMVINSNKDKENLERSTNPAALFTVAIGGNIVSRGVTFNNLLSMYFTRSVKGKMQQDTYIQRARMFGARGEYLKYFDLSIPKDLYDDWHRCFVYNKLALESVKNGNIPVWIEGGKTKPVANSSIDKNTVEMSSGEMSYAKFDYKKYDNRIDLIINNSNNHISKLRELQGLLGIEVIPSYLIDFIEQQKQELIIHSSTDISNRANDTDKENISRARGLIGKSEEERTKYPNCSHHIKIFFASNNGRVFYKYTDSLKFLKNMA